MKEYIQLFYTYATLALVILTIGFLFGLGFIYAVSDNIYIVSYGEIKK
jgi:high-affinity nickel permease